MRKRLLLPLGLLACLVAGSVAVLWLTGPRHRINQHGFAMIKKGMTRVQVEELMRVPAGDDPPVHCGYVFPTKCWVPLTEKTETGERATWYSDFCVIRVVFDPNGEAIWAGCYPRARESFTDKLRRWLGLPWW